MQDIPPPRNAKSPSKRTGSPEFILRGDFAAVLDGLRCSLAISTWPNQLLLVGASDGLLTVTASMVAQPMGLAASGDRLAIATPRSIVIFANIGRLAAHYPGRPDYYDAFFAPRAMHFTGDCHIHDMIFAARGIIGANTNFSCICRVDAGGFSFTPFWQPSFISQLRPEDRCHLNGFTGENGELRYVTALAATDSPGGWRETLDAGGILIDTARNAILRDNLCMPHSPRLFDGELYLLNGGEGEVLRVDRSTGVSTVLAALPAFTHGLCKHGGVIFVGMSQNRISRKRNPPPIAQRVVAPVAGVAALDAKTGRILGAIEFTSGVSEVYDVQPLPGIRRAGIQNLLASDGFVGIETPNSVFWTKRPENDPRHLAEIAGTDHYQLKIAEL